MNLLLVGSLFVFWDRSATCRGEENKTVLTVSDLQPHRQVCICGESVLVAISAFSEPEYLKVLIPLPPHNMGSPTASRDPFRRCQHSKPQRNSTRELVPWRSETEQLNLEIEGWFLLVPVGSQGKCWFIFTGYYQLDEPDFVCRAPRMIPGYLLCGDHSSP